MTNETKPLSPAAARRELDALTTHTDCDPNRRDSCAHDIANEISRDILCADFDDALENIIEFDYYRDNYDPAETHIDTDALATRIFELLCIIADDPYSTQYLSMLRLDHSLCPMHSIDYAICFDDEDPECALLRAYFPNHDT